MRVLDVGCGPGGLAVELAGASARTTSPRSTPPRSSPLPARAQPGADVREGVAESLPWDDDTFDAALSCLVIGFMRDADAGVREMARVSKPGGTVGACMWDIAAGGMTMLRIFWHAMRAVDPAWRASSAGPVRGTATSPSVWSAPGCMAYAAAP